MQHLPRNSPQRWAAIALPPKQPLGRWIAIGVLCAMIGAACLVERFPLLAG